MEVIFHLGGAKFTPKIEIYYQDLIRLNSNESFVIPIIATKDIDVGAISLILNYPKKLVMIDNVQFSTINGNNKLEFHIQENELRIGWYEDENDLNLKQNKPIIIISGKTTGNFEQGDIIKFSIFNNSLCEFADESGNPIDKVVLKTYLIEYANSQNIESKWIVSNNDLFIFPNPAENSVNIRYNIANDGFVKISLYNVLGEKVFDVVDKLVLKGVYNSEINLNIIY